MAKLTMDETITEVRLSPSNHEVIKANGSFTVCGQIAVKFSVVQGKEGLFISLPRQKSRKEENKWYDEVFPITREGRIEMTKILLNEYEKMLKNPPVPTPKKTPF